MVNKQVDAPASPPPKSTLARSVEKPPDNLFAGPGGGNTFTMWLASVADTFTPWGTNYVKRDQELRDFFHTETFLSGAVYTSSITNAQLQWKLDGPEQTVEAVLDLLNSANMGKGWAHFAKKLSLDLYCLYGKSTISLGGDRLGQRKNIKQMVDERDPGPVLSVDRNGYICERRVNQWEKTPLGHRKWVWISTKNTYQHSGNRRGGLWLTDDHPILTDQGWLPAGEIKPRMQVATRDAQISRDQAEMLVGTLLGDASLRRPARRPFIKLCHTEKQAQWRETKQKALAGFTWSPVDAGGTVHSSGSFALDDWENAWYPEGKKAVPRDLVHDHLTSLMLATWFMDDGSIQHNHSKNGNATRPSAFISTNGFRDEDNEWLAELLSENQIATTVQDAGNYKRLYIGADGSETLFERIGPYVIPELRYKLPDNAPEFDESLWMMRPAQPYFDEVLKAETKPLRTGPSGIVRTTYHLGVEETRNFIANGIVVHNTQDNGAFVEVIRQRNSPDASVVGIQVLDSGRCQRTGDLNTPVIYTDRVGTRHKMPWYSIIPFEEFPSSVETMYDLQYCAVTRALRAAQILRDFAIYKGEKAGGRFADAIHIVGGVSSQDLKDVQDRAAEEGDNAGQARFLGALVIGSLDPESTPSVATLDFKSLPDAFNLDDEMRWYISSLALAFGRDYQDFAPLPTGNLGSGQQSETLHKKARQKAAASFMRMLEQGFNFFGIMPQTVTFEFELPDLEEDKQTAEIAKIWSETFEKMVAAEVIPPDVARTILVDEGILKPELADGIKDEDFPDMREPSKEPDASPNGRPTRQLEDPTKEVDTLLGRLKERAKGYPGLKALIETTEKEMTLEKKVDGLINVVGALQEEGLQGAVDEALKESVKEIADSTQQTIGEALAQLERTVTKAMSQIEARSETRTTRAEAEMLRIVGAEVQRARKEGLHEIIDDRLSGPMTEIANSALRALNETAKTMQEDLNVSAVHMSDALEIKAREVQEAVEKARLEFAEESQERDHKVKDAMDGLTQALQTMREAQEKQKSIDEITNARVREVAEGLIMVDSEVLKRNKNGLAEIIRKTMASGAQIDYEVIRDKERKFKNLRAKK